MLQTLATGASSDLLSCLHSSDFHCLEHHPTPHPPLGNVMTTRSRPRVHSVSVLVNVAVAWSARPDLSGLLQRRPSELLWTWAPASCPVWVSELRPCSVGRMESKPEAGLSCTLPRLRPWTALFPVPESLLPLPRVSATTRVRERLSEKRGPLLEVGEIAGEQSCAALPGLPLPSEARDNGLKSPGRSLFLG